MGVILICHDNSTETAKQDMEIGTISSMFFRNVYPFVAGYPLTLIGRSSGTGLRLVDVLFGALYALSCPIRYYAMDDATATGSAKDACGVIKQILVADPNATVVAFVSNPLASELSAYYENDSGAEVWSLKPGDAYMRMDGRQSQIVRAAQ